MDKLPKAAQELIDDFFKKLEALGEPSVAIVMAVTNVDSFYGNADQHINVVFGGPTIDHRCYGDMVMSISHDIHAAMSTVVATKGGGGIASALDELLESMGIISKEPNDGSQSH